MPADNPGAEFGSCCEGLKDALTNTDFDPLFAVDEAGVLYMSVGVMLDGEGDGEDNEPSMVDHPVYFCPFCGTKLQTEEEVDAKLGAEAA
jgi:hypothetical protein